MSTRTIQETVTTTFEIIACWQCNIRWAMPEEFVAQRRRDGKGFYCPNGHSCAYNETEADRIKREAEKKITSLQQSLAWAEESKRSWRESAERAENRLRATKGVVTKLKKRVGNGVCPCCNRTFSNLARHMHSQHPDFSEEKEPSE